MIYGDMFLGKTISQEGTTRHSELESQACIPLLSEITGLNRNTLHNAKVNIPTCKSLFVAEFLATDPWCGPQFVYARVLRVVSVGIVS